MLDAHLVRDEMGLDPRPSRSRHQAKAGGAKGAARCDERPSLSHMGLPNCAPRGQVFERRGIFALYIRAARGGKVSRPCTASHFAGSLPCCAGPVRLARLADRLMRLESAPSAGPAAVPRPPKAPAALPSEVHLADLKQLTFGGENAEAYWSFDGERADPAGSRGMPRVAIASIACARSTARRPWCRSRAARARRPARTSCPAIARSSTRRRIWAATRARRSPITARATCGRSTTRTTSSAPNADGSSVDAPHRHAGLRRRGDGLRARTARSSSRRVRDGDIELYRMDADGKNVKRLTHTPGYDGGAFFNADCTKIVWRASRPKPGEELDDYQAAARAEGLVRPTKLELYVANADGIRRRADHLSRCGVVRALLAPVAEAHPLLVELRRSARAASSTSGRSTSTAPTSSGSRTRRRLRRLPDVLARRAAPRVLVEPGHRPKARTTPTCSSRAGSSDAPGPASSEDPRAADRVMEDITWLADPSREGRGVGTAGLEPSGGYIEKRYQELGLSPAGDADGYRQAFSVTTGRQSQRRDRLSRSGKRARSGAIRPGRVFAQRRSARRSRLRRLRHQLEGAGRRRLREARRSKGRSSVVRRFVPEGGQVERSRRAAPVRRHSLQGVDGAREGGRRAHRRRRSAPAPRCPEGLEGARRGAARAAAGRELR